MARKKVERLLNLVICLLETREYVSAAYIRKHVVGYSDDPTSTDVAFNRMFERDKAELRTMGLPLRTGPTPRESDVEGYRIQRDQYELPEIPLADDEAAAVAMAAVVWDSPDVEALIQSAIRKLKVAGIDVRGEEGIQVSPRSISSQPVMRALIDAASQRQAVTFSHRPAGSAVATRRTLEPWTVRIHRGQGYVIGLDRDRADTRTFRLSRITDVATVGKPGAFNIPDGLDFDAIIADVVERAASGAAAGSTARVWVRTGGAMGLRRMATSSEAMTNGGVDGDVLSIPISSESTLTRTILSTGADAVVLSPDVLRGNVIAGLDKIIAAGGR